jgi:dimethylargininase
MDRLFDSVIVRPPSNSYQYCVSSNPAKASIDIQLAREQHRSYVSILKENGINVLELRSLQEFPDSVFMQDPAILGVRRSILGRFGESSRRGEVNRLFTDLHQIELMKRSDLLRIDVPGTLEGGDIMITDQQKLFVGESSRTNSVGILQFQSILQDFNVIKVKTRLFHLLCGCSYLSQSTMVIAPELVSSDNFPGLKYVRLRTEDAYASDALYLGERRVLIPAGYPNASKKLRDADYIPVEADVSEFHKGDGGVTCLCSPIYSLL